MKMTVKIQKTNPAQNLRQHVIDAWQTGHGGTADQVHTMIGEDGLVIIIPKALYQAEVVLFRNAQNSAKILDQYLRTLLESISEDLLPAVEDYTGRHVHEIVPLVDLKAGWMTIFYRLQ
jgi:hypothetical protein